ncbi:DUF6188 family protein [Mycobacterium kyogaense]|uniref:DUF6188 family protein n=1 Tax=Mycobacterium kyogaense TaxID=2212479 RepID=UPI001F09B2DC|nr:DUF6188 family protein [Mycobacterium kyogaense]
MMDLGLNGKKLQSVLIENSIVMQLSDEHFALIASPLVLTRNGEVFTLTPDEDPQEAFQPIRQLVGLDVSESTADDSGALKIAFTDGSLIQVPADDAYEAWNVSGPNGALVVSMPGGELAIWNAQTDQDGA